MINELAGLLVGYGLIEAIWRAGRWSIRYVVADLEHKHELERRAWLAAEPFAAQAPTQLEMNSLALYQVKRQSWQETVPHIGPVTLERDAKADRFSGVGVMGTSAYDTGLQSAAFANLQRHQQYETLAMHYQEIKRQQELQVLQQQIADGTAFANALPVDYAADSTFRFSPANIMNAFPPVEELAEK